MQLISGAIGKSKLKERAIEMQDDVILIIIDLNIVDIGDDEIKLADNTGIISNAPMIKIPVNFTVRPIVNDVVNRMIKSNNFRFTPFVIAILRSIDNNIILRNDNAKNMQYNTRRLQITTSASMFINIISPNKIFSNKMLFSVMLLINSAMLKNPLDTNAITEFLLLEP